MLQQAVDRVQGAVETEASGNVVLETVRHTGRGVVPAAGGSCVASLPCSLLLLV